MLGWMSRCCFFLGRRMSNVFKGNGFKRAQAHLSFWWGVAAGLIFGVPLSALLVMAWRSYQV